MRHCARPRAAVVLSVLVTLSLAGGCSQLPPPGAAATPPESQPQERLVWPPPPDAPRIEYLSSISGTRDVQRAPSFFRRLGELVAGRSEEWLVRPTAVAASDDLLAVADTGAPALFLFDRTGKSMRKVTQADGQELVSPVGVAIGDGDAVYLSDSFLRRIYHYGRDGALRDVIGGEELQRPTGLAFDAPRQRLYVTDTGMHHVLAYDAQGNLLLSFGERGVDDGEFNYPSQLCVDSAGSIYVVDSFNFRVQIFDAQGHFVATFGRQGDGSGDFARPKGIGVDSGGHVYVVDALFGAVQIFDRSGQFLMGFGRQGRDPGEFWLPVGMAMDRTDRIYIADSYNQRIQIFRFLGSD